MNYYSNYKKILQDGYIVYDSKTLDEKQIQELSNLVPNIKPMRLYYGVEQSHCGHEYRFVFEKEEVERIVDHIALGEYTDYFWPMGGSNSSATCITELNGREEIKAFLTAPNEGPDVEDPMLVDLAEYILTIDTEEGCAQKFLDKFGLTAKELEQYDSRYDECESMIAELKDLTDEIDFENPFYGDSREMRYSELCDLYEGLIKRK